MLKEEYTVSILDSKWKEVKRNINILFIPRKNEYIYLDEQYYEVINIVHVINEKQDIFIIIDEVVKKEVP
jgi:hypothetical protein